MSRRFSACGYLVACLLSLALIATPAAAGALYWVDNDDAQVQRAGLDGQNSAVVLPPAAAQNPGVLAVDPASGHLYWSASFEFDGLVKRADVDGGSAFVLFTTGEARVPGIALDLGAGKLYYTDPSDCVPCGSVQRRNLDGSEREFLITDLNGPEALAIDPSRDRMCWSDLHDDTIVCARMDGSDVEILVDATESYGVAIDPADGRIYWTDRAGSRLRRALPDGSDVEDLVLGQAEPRGIAIDAVARKLYWCDPAAGTIQRSDLDGSDVEIVVSDPAPTSIALDTTGGGSDPVPGLSEWGLLLLLLLFLATGALAVQRMHP